MGWNPLLVASGDHLVSAMSRGAMEDPQPGANTVARGIACSPGDDLPPSGRHDVGGRAPRRLGLEALTPRAGLARWGIRRCEAAKGHRAGARRQQETPGHHSKRHSREAPPVPALHEPHERQVKHARNFDGACESRNQSHRREPKATSQPADQGQSRPRRRSRQASSAREDELTPAVGPGPQGAAPSIAFRPSRNRMPTGLDRTSPLIENGGRGSQSREEARDG